MAFVVQLIKLIIMSNLYCLCFAKTSTILTLKVNGLLKWNILVEIGKRFCDFKWCDNVKGVCLTVIYYIIFTLEDLNRQNMFKLNLIRSCVVIAIIAYIADVNKLPFTIVPLPKLSHLTKLDQIVTKIL